jgi:hypothetical protein
VPLDYPGTLNGLAHSRAALADGMRLVVYSHDADSGGQSDDLVGLCTVRLDGAARRWFGVVDPRTLLHVSELDREDREAFQAARKCGRPRLSRDSPPPHRGRQRRSRHQADVPCSLSFRMFMFLSRDMLRGDS